MSFASPSQASQPSSNTTLAQLLHAADSLSTSFNKFHSSSLSSVLSIQSSCNQLSNLMALPDSRVMRSGAGGGGMKERGMAKVQESIEGGLVGVRDDLGKMEGVVESLNALLFQADLFLATPGTALAHGLNPLEALTHVSALFSCYQAELIRLRELLADFTSEEMGVEEWVGEWRVMKEVDQKEEEELSDLVGILGSWGGTGDVDMF